MDKFPVLKTDRLQLRKPAAKDLPDIIEYAGNPKIAEMTLNIPHPYREKDAIFFLNKVNQGFEDESEYIFAICLQPDDKLVGVSGLNINHRFDRAMLGYWIGEPFWNNGYATEAIGAVLKFGFGEIGLNKISATHFPENPASGKVMSKNGMKKEARLTEHVQKQGAYKDVVQYRLTRTEFLERP